MQNDNICMVFCHYYFEIHSNAVLEANCDIDF